jgi:transcriptional regulator NrdR family protein
MASEVIKKDGSKEAFDPEKIKRSILAAAQGANLAEERASEVVEQVSKAAIEMAEAKEIISTSEIKDKILSDLDEIEPSVSAAWRQHDQEKGR